jgi:hypothetical protein
MTRRGLGELTAEQAIELIMSGKLGKPRNIG